LIENRRNSFLKEEKELELQFKKDFKQQIIEFEKQNISLSARVVELQGQLNDAIESKGKEVAEERNKIENLTKEKNSFQEDVQHLQLRLQYKKIHDQITATTSPGK
jgi:hypothetical protein